VIVVTVFLLLSALIWEKKVMRLLTGFSFLLLFAFPCGVHAQGHHAPMEHSSNAHRPQFRAAILIGHTLIPEEHAGENFLIPSWGLDLEYWPYAKWGVGLHSDLEIETFVILRNGGEQGELERLSPLVLTLDILYKPWKGLVLQLGPGLEIERSENFNLWRAGLEYEIELGHHWDLAPTLFYDSRSDEYHTWSFALGVGKRF
jgi:hypothetical protein